MKLRFYRRRYIYHYRVNKVNYTFSGITQLSFRIVTQDDLEALKGLVSDHWKESVTSVHSLSYLGRESILHWIKHCLGKCL